MPHKDTDEQQGIEYEKDGGGTTATLVVGGLILLMILALGGLLYLTFANCGRGSAPRNPRAGVRMPLRPR